MIKVGFKKVKYDAVLPVKAHETDSGFDLFTNEEAILVAGQTKVIKTGIAISLPAGYEAQVRPRSGITSKTKLRVQIGTIDNSYVGEIGIIVDYVGVTQREIDKGTKLAQLVIAPVPQVEAYEIDELPVTERSDNGFGSTGV